MASDSSLQNAQAQNYVAAMVPENAKARVEIEEFLGDNDMTNLFLLALLEMQKEDPEKKTKKNSQDWWSFYSLSGTWFNILIWFHSLILVQRHSWLTAGAMERCSEWQRAQQGGRSLKGPRLLYTWLYCVSNMAPRLHIDVRGKRANALALSIAYWPGALSKRLPIRCTKLRVCTKMRNKGEGT